MKKILFIMILATTFIPVPQTGASIGEMNGSNKAKVKEAQIMVEKAPDNISVNESNLMHGKIKEEKTKISNNSRQKLVKKSMSSEKRDRLFGLLLLAHGGQR